jgi:hypothetical protein
VWLCRWTVAWSVLVSVYVCVRGHVHLKLTVMFFGREQSKCMIRKRVAIYILLFILQTCCRLRRVLLVKSWLFICYYLDATIVKCKTGHIAVYIDTHTFICMCASIYCISIWYSYSKISMCLKRFGCTRYTHTISTYQLTCCMRPYILYIYTAPKKTISRKLKCRVLIYYFGLNVEY